MGQKKRRMEWSRTLRGLCPRKRKRRKRRERRNSPGFLMETSRLSAGRMGNITYSPLLIFMSINYIIIVHKDDHSYFKTKTYWKEIHTETLNFCSPGCFCLLLHLFTAQSSYFFSWFRENSRLAAEVYKDMPETSFTRTISNPEVVMKRRRQQKLEKRMQEFMSSDGRPDSGKSHPSVLFSL